MTDTTRIIDEIRAALEKVEVSEWYEGEVTGSGLTRVDDGKSSGIFPIRAETFEAKYIVAANPANVAALLDHVTAQAEQIERVSDLLTAAVDDYNGALARARELEGAFEAAAEDVDKAWREKGGIGCTEVCAIIRARTILTGEQQ